MIDISRKINMSKEEVVDCIMKIYNERGRVNKNSIYEYSKKINKPLFQRCIEYFGNINNMYNELGINNEKNIYNIKNKINIDEVSIINTIELLYNKYNYITLRLLRKEIDDFDIDYNCKKLKINIKKLLLDNGYICYRVYGNNVFKKKNKINFNNKKEVDFEVLSCYNEFFSFSETILNNFNPYIIKNGVIKFYKDFDNMCKKLNLIVDLDKKIDRQFLNNELEKVLSKAKNKNKNEKISKLMFVKETNIPESIINRIYGSFDNLISLNSNANEYNKSLDITKKRVDDEIISIHQKAILDNEKFNIRYYHNNCKYSWYLENKFYNSFQDAVEKLGLSNNLIKDCNRDDIKNEIIRIYKEYGFFSVELFRQKNIFKNKGTRYVYENIDGNFTTLLNELGIELNKITSTAYLLIMTISKILNKEPILEISFDWLRNRNNNKYRMDALFKENNLIIEYNGRQHYEWVKMFHKTEQEFITYKEDYDDKVKKLKDRGYSVLEWNYKDVIKEDTIIEKLKQLKIM